MIPGRLTYIQGLRYLHAIALEAITQVELEHNLAQLQVERTRTALVSARRDLRSLETAFQRESEQADPSRSPATDSDCTLHDETDSVEEISDNEEEATG